MPRRFSLHPLTLGIAASWFACGGTAIVDGDDGPATTSSEFAEACSITDGCCAGLFFTVPF